VTAKITIELDEKVRRALKQAALNLGRPEKEITELAIRHYLHLDIVDRLGQSKSQLSEEEAAKIANAEVHADRRDRRRTA
jgi:predicted transcriptional regulator